MKKIQKRSEIIEYGIITILSVVMLLGMMGALTGKWLFDGNSYNSYALQADSWRHGRLDLGQDYPWLELAIYEGKYYVSFPPFPSYILFPFTFFFESSTPDYFILLVINIISVSFTYKIAVKAGLLPFDAMISTFFTTIGSNMLFVMIDPSVWFLAQALCFMTTVLAIYSALSGKGGWALFFWACSVGCRPMQAVFFPVLLMILYRKEKDEFPEENLLNIVKRRWKWLIPAGIVAMSYMTLNYARFGNVFEFGHNYLPEFVRAENGQFHVSYMWENLKILFQMPEFTEQGRMIINNMGSLSMLIVNPIVLFLLIEFFFCIIKRDKHLLCWLSGILLMSVFYMLIVVMHRTMGGWHFGNRYSNDILPWIYLGTVIVHTRFQKFVKYQIPFCIMAIGLNVVGSVIVYNGLT